MTLQLPRLPQIQGDWASFQVWWQQVVEAIEAQEALQDQAIADIQAAQATATSSARELARISSYPSPSALLSAADVGTTATITIDPHTRIYPVQGSIDVPDVVIPGSGTVTGLSFATLYFVYYDDTTLADTTPTYLATTTAATAQVGAAAGRHFVGSVTTPVDGGGGTTGGGYQAPGGVEP